MGSLDQRLQAGAERVDISVKADRNLPYDVVKKLVVALESRRSKGGIRMVYAGVSARENQ